jgi:hypothetical protein
MGWETIIAGSVSTGLLMTGVAFFIFRIIMRETISNYFQSKYDEFKNKIDKDMEIHRSHIRLYEFIYPKRLAALDELYELRENVLPENHAPDMEWEDACSEISGSFVPFRRRVKSSIIKYGSILPDHVVGHLRSAILACQNGEYLDGAPANECANRFFEELEKAIAALRKDMEIQIK